MTVYILLAKDNEREYTYVEGVYASYEIAKTVMDEYFNSPEYDYNTGYKIEAKELE